MLPIVILTLASTGFCLFLIAIPYFFAPKDKNSETKASAYECGLAPKQKRDSQISVKFFLTAILFILFDIEIIFLYPFALAYRDFLQTEQALGIILAMGIFILLFIFGLWWEIKSKALDWK
ncbi:MAG: NADH-quinone oxidoreductase subunit A [Oligoflexia bacterium]|nr:NADH-quinone oxidoreductase subunit A [Oligoflexia bacterium]